MSISCREKLCLVVFCQMEVWLAKRSSLEILESSHKHTHAPGDMNCSNTLKAASKSLRPLISIDSPDTSKCPDRF